MSQIVLSASAINDFRACPIRWRNAYLYGLRPIVDKDSLRQGSVWHRCLALLSSKPGGECVQCSGETCQICGGTRKLPDNLLDAIITYVNQEYSEVPPNKTYEDWVIERAIILSSLMAFHHHYSGVEYKVIANEIRFEMPLYSPENGGQPFSKDEVVIHGTIDQLLRDKDGNIIIREFKSTSKSLDDEEYWGHLSLDVQTLIYLMATQYLQQTGKLEIYGIRKDNRLAAGLLYNVWHKPQIRPSWLTQGDSKKFVETGEYCRQKFGITGLYKSGESCFVNNEIALIKPGAKEGTFAIYETPQMFSARLFQDISERPTFYFQQREIARTGQDLKCFWHDLYNMYKTMRAVLEHNWFYPCEKQCYATFKCDYMNLCNNHVEIDFAHPPDGFEFIHKGKK